MQNNKFSQNSAWLFVMKCRSMCTCAGTGRICSWPSRSQCQWWRM